MPAHARHGPTHLQGAIDEILPLVVVQVPVQLPEGIWLSLDKRPAHPGRRWQGSYIRILDPSSSSIDLRARPGYECMEDLELQGDSASLRRGQICWMGAPLSQFCHNDAAGFSIALASMSITSGSTMELRGRR